MRNAPAFLIRLALLLAALGLIWAPELRWARLRAPSASAADVAAAVTEPAREALDAVATVDLAELDDTPPMPAAVARQLEEGQMDWPGVWSRSPASGYPDDYLRGRRLYMASLAVENLLLRGYERTRDPVFLRVALRRTLQMGQFEATRWHDRTFLWNDHAVASRVSTLVSLWRFVRADPQEVQAHGAELLSFVRRCGQLLADPARFTVRTNHGVMQNVALLQLSAAFPSLPEAPGWRRIAMERLLLQLGFYVSPEGAVLEHSAGYHIMGQRLLGYARELVALNGMPPQPQLERAYRGVAAVTRALVRPDGTLPLVGNSVTRALGVPVPTPVSAPAELLLPVSGWDIWGSPVPGSPGAASQTMVAWSRFEGHGHKRPDETSVHFASRGINWITASGYWPYGAPLEVPANTWLASNAPHAPGEPGNSPRRSELLAWAVNGDARFVTVRRTNAAGPTFERQVVQLAPECLLVLDFTESSPSGSETLWTLDPRLHAAPRDKGDGVVSDRVSGSELRLAISLSSAQAGLTTRLLRGSSDPFGGWVVVDGEPRRADSIFVRQPAPSSAVATLIEVAKDGLTRVQLEPGATPHRWAVKMNLRGESQRVSRDDDRLDIGTAGSSDAVRLSLVHADAQALAREREPIELAFRSAVAMYPPWHDYWFYRERASIAILALAFALEVVHLAASRLWRRPPQRRHALMLPVHAALVIAAALVLRFVYLGQG